MMSRIDAHAMAKNTFEENFSVQKCLTIITGSQTSKPRELLDIAGNGKV